MVHKSYGKMRRTRKKLTGKRIRGITPYIREFSEGDAVHVDFIPSSRLPHPRFHGTTGRIVGRRGRSYMVQITDKSAVKTLFLRPEHLRPQSGKGRKEAP